MRPTATRSNNRHRALEKQHFKMRSCMAGSFYGVQIVSVWLHRISWAYIRIQRALLHLNRLPIHTRDLNISFFESLHFPVSGTFALALDDAVRTPSPARPIRSFLIPTDRMLLWKSMVLARIIAHRFTFFGYPKIIWVSPAVDAGATHGH